MKIHITLLGKEALPVYYPIESERPDIVHLLGTVQNKNIARRLSQTISNIEIECIIHEVDAYEIQSVIDICENIHSEYSENDQFTYNLTGGTKPMALGAFVVAQKYKAKVIYTDSHSIIDLFTFEKEPLKCKLDNNTIFSLQGQTVKSYNVYNDDSETLECASKIMEYVIFHGKKHSTLIGIYNKYKGCMPQYWANENLKCNIDGAHIQVFYDGESILDITHPDARKLLFGGRWWEILVAHAIYDWSGGMYEIWHDVKFAPKNIDNKYPDNDKNEIDLLFNIGNTIVFVECKSGNFNQDNIFKLKFIRETYGSDKSKSVLISFYPIKNDLKEKAREAKVDIVFGNKTHSALKEIPDRFTKMLNSLKV